MTTACFGIRDQRLLSSRSLRNTTSILARHRVIRSRDLKAIEK
jgi:hypothetical protein